MNNIWLTFGLVVIILYRIVSILYRLPSNSYSHTTKLKIQKQCSSPIVITDKPKVTQQRRYRITFEFATVVRQCCYKEKNDKNTA